MQFEVWAGHCARNVWRKRALAQLKTMHASFGGGAEAASSGQGQGAPANAPPPLSSQSLELFREAVDHDVSNAVRAQPAGLPLTRGACRCTMTTCCTPLSVLTLSVLTPRDPACPIPPGARGGRLEGAYALLSHVAHAPFWVVCPLLHRPSPSLSSQALALERFSPLPLPLPSLPGVDPRRGNGARFAAGRGRRHAGAR